MKRLNQNPRINAVEFDHSSRFGAARGFTLIELLTVISIIGVLAGLLVGLAPIASRKMKESRMRAELTQLSSLIQEYKADLGFYPPDNPTTNKHLNPLFYELSGAIFSKQTKTFKTLKGSEEIGVDALKNTFQVRGIANSGLTPGEVKFKFPFKQSHYKEITPNPDIELLVAPLRGPYGFWPGKDINPWFYDSSSRNRNNPEGFDLWADVIIGNKVFRFSNWSKDPIPLN